MRSSVCVSSEIAIVFLNLCRISALIKIRRPIFVAGISRNPYYWLFVVQINLMENSCRAVISIVYIGKLRKASKEAHTYIRNRTDLLLNESWLTATPIAAIFFIFYIKCGKRVRSDFRRRTVYKLMNLFRYLLLVSIFVAYRMQLSLCKIFFF